MPVISQELSNSSTALLVEHGPSPNPELPVHDKQALHYAAGYIPRKLRRKFQRNPGNKSAQLYRSVVETWAKCAEQENPYNASTDPRLTEEVTEWTSTQDRGGLLYCSPEFFAFMKMLEIQFQKLFHVDNIVNFAGKNVVPVLVSKLKGSCSILETFRNLVHHDLSDETLCEGLLDEVLSSWVYTRANRVVKQYIFKLSNTKGHTVSKMGTPALRKTLDKFQ